MSGHYHDVFFRRGRGGRQHMLPTRRSVCIRCEFEATEHRSKLVEGEDYFSVRRRELPTNFVANSVEGNPNIEVILLAESGYLMLVA